MTSIFRMATMQAVKEIVEENSVSGRFGHIVTEENIEEISKKIVDLFEMTLDLRAKTQEIFALSQGAPQGQGARASTPGRAPAKKNRVEFQEESPFPTTRNAAEIYDSRQTMASHSREATPSPTGGLDLKLPRQRFEMTLGEKERFMRR